MSTSRIRWSASWLVSAAIGFSASVFMSVAAAAADNGVDGIVYTGEVSPKALRTSAPAFDEDAQLYREILLPPLANSRIQQVVETAGKRQPVALWRDLGTVAANTEVHTTSDGRVLTYYKIISTGARALRMGVTTAQLPAGMTLTFFDSNQRFLGELTSSVASAAADQWWSPPSSGESVLIEVSAKQVADLGVTGWLTRVSHRFSDGVDIVSGTGFEKSLGSSGSCQINITCDSDWLTTASAVARMYYEANGAGFTCSGTLLNNSASNFDPLFLTANHCIDSQAVASTLVTDWFFRSPTCGTTTASTTTISRTGGSDLLTTDVPTDTTLLRLRDAPPSGVQFLGWTPDEVSIGSSLVGIHHPSGDVKKISRSTVTAHQNCTNDVNGSFSCSPRSPSDPDALYLEIQNSSGVTEPGSSGSMIVLADSRRVVGTLRGGSSSCTSPGDTDSYGKFSAAYTRSNWATYLNPTSSSSSATAFIERFYTNILGRSSDPAGLAAWQNLIQTQSAAQVALGFFKSAEFAALGLNDDAFVRILYSTLFNREPDDAGMAVWMNALAGGRLREMVIYGFLRSQEFSDLSASFGVTAFNTTDQNRFGLLSFVERFYQLVLKREPDTGGFVNWVNTLSSGQASGGDIARGLFLSAEYIAQNNDDATFVSTCYQAFFDRAADPAGSEGWLSVLAQGGSRSTVVNGFIASGEFASLAARFGIRAQ